MAKVTLKMKYCVVEGDAEGMFVSLEQAIEHATKLVNEIERPQYVCQAIRVVRAIQSPVAVDVVK